MKQFPSVVTINYKVKNNKGKVYGMLNIQELIENMTLEEKASLCSGKGFWYTEGVERLNLPPIAMNDGPHGLRKPEKNDSFSNSLPSTCFPTYSALGSSWDTELVQSVGEAIADEALSNDVSILLGPGINIKRSPLCGRNFEYFSEDPYLSGEMGSAFIDGVQSKGVGTSLKHYAVNSQETRRMLIDAVVDERALREIYLAAFENAVKHSKPWTIMAAYNKLNGAYCTENTELLERILRDEWGYDGLVVTDWGACNDRVEGIKSGQDIEMPGNEYNDEKIVDAVNNGELGMEVLDKTVERILKLIDISLQNRKKNHNFDIDKHNDLASRACSQSAVLLKNDGILPLSKNTKIAVIGELADKPHFQGGGSSKINPLKIETPLEAFMQDNVAYAKGYDIKSVGTNKELLDEASAAAKKADVVLVFAGFTDAEECEGVDKQSIDLPKYMNDAIRAATQANPNTIVVLQNGSAVTMPWLSEVKAVLECYLPGQASGRAIYDLVMGNVNPSGKLAETFPAELSDNPSFQWFPGGPGTVEYRESVYVGYRYYDTAKSKVLFPFGFGLSYTTFEYEDIKLSADKIDFDEDIMVTVEVKNTGKRGGAEVVQLYVTDEESTVFRPSKELKAFKKIWLDPGEKKEVSFTLNKRSFAYYNTSISDWHVEQGNFIVSVGSSSADLRLKAKLFVQSTKVDIPDYRETAPEYYNLSSEHLSISDKSFSALLGKDIPENVTKVKRPFDHNSTIVDIKKVFVGRILYKIFVHITKRQDISEFDSIEAITRQLEQLPLRSIGAISGMISAIQIEGILQMVNGKPIRGLVKFIRNK